MLLAPAGPAAVPTPTSSPVPQPPSGGLGDLLRGGAGGGLVGGLTGGLGSLLERLTANGHGDVAGSWLGNGPNQPIQPAQLGPAIGQTTVSELARNAGMSEQDLLAQLSKVLPGV